MEAQETPTSAPDGDSPQIDRRDRSGEARAVISAGKRAYVAGYQDGYRAARHVARLVLRQRILGFALGVLIYQVVSYVL